MHRDVRHGELTPVEHLQFRAAPAWTVARAIAGLLTWPLVLPLALLARTSDVVFRTVSELLSLLPYLFGVIVRSEFYRLTLRQCGRNLVVEFGAVFVYRDVIIGNHVLIGRFSLIHHCDVGDYVLIGERCTFLSGSRQHGIDRTDVPMALQPGQVKRIVIGDDCWIGAHAVVMEDVGRGSVVGAGSVVTRPVESYALVAGNPARRMGRREPVQRTAPLAQASPATSAFTPASAGTTSGPGSQTT